jgi:CrcB protein
MPRTILAVLVGGVLGTGLRLLADTVIPHVPGELPLSTLLVNLVGAFALGLLVAKVWPTASDWLRAGLGAGLLGSFTTFSAIAVAMIELPLASAALYLGLSTVLGLASALLGLRLGRPTGAVTIDPVNE